MTSEQQPVRVPPVTAWLVELFAAPHEADGILGDLAEEFCAGVARDGEAAARRHYRRQAFRTIVDLALSPLRSRAASSAAITWSGVARTLGIGLLGLLPMWPIGFGIGLLTRALVTTYPVYYYVPARLFWMSVPLMQMLVTGIVIAGAARLLGRRPMSVAVATVILIALVLALDAPILMWRYGPPGVAQITILSWAARWARGVAMFGSMIMIGAAIGRLLPYHRRAEQMKPAQS